MRQSKGKRSHPTALPPASYYHALWIIFLIFLFIILASIGGFASLIQEPSDVLPTLAVGLALLIPTMIAGLLLLNRYRRAKRLDEQGQITQGQIVEAWVKASSDAPNEYYVIYQFGDGMQATQQVEDREFQKLNVGTAVAVRYLPDDPQCSRMAR